MILVNSQSRYSLTPKSQSAQVAGRWRDQIERAPCRRLDTKSPMLRMSSLDGPRLRSTPAHILIQQESNDGFTTCTCCINPQLFSFCATDHQDKFAQIQMLCAIELSQYSTNPFQACRQSKNYAASKKSDIMPSELHYYRIPQHEKSKNSRNDSQNTYSVLPSLSHSLATQDV